MNYTQLIRDLQSKHLYLFSTQDLLLLNPGAHRKTLQNQLSEWVERRYLLRLKRDLYELLEKGAEAGKSVPDLVVANRLLEPSYISCETALSIFGGIPEYSVQVTSVTTKPSRTFRNERGSFSYRSCQPRAFQGYHLGREEGYPVKIATPEKALVDYVYFKGREIEAWSFEEERIDPEFVKKLDWGRVVQWGELYSKRCQRDLRELKRWQRAHPG